MNRSQAWKFLLSIVTLWLAIAKAGPAQTPVGSCTGQTIACNSSSDVNCGSTSGSSTCTIKIDNNGQISLSTNGTALSDVCVITGTTIQWKVALSGNAPTAAYIVEFPTGSGANPFGTAAPLFLGTNTDAVPQGDTINASAGTCWEYTVAYCGGGNDCVDADPRVLVTCPQGQMCAPPPPTTKPMEPSKKPQK